MGEGLIPSKIQRFSWRKSEEKSDSEAVYLRFFCILPK